MSLSYLQPYAGSHAVQQATFVITWAPMDRRNPDGVTENVLLNIADCFEKRGLESIKPLRLLQVTFGPAGQQRSNEEAEVGYEARMPGTSGRAFAAVTATAAEGLAIHVQEYTRWAEVFSKVQPVLHAVLSVVGNVQPVIKIGLQVVDTFTWNGSLESVPTEKIFRRPSPWLPEHVFACRSFWHAHHGFYEETAEEDCVRQLNNVNVNVSENGGKPAVQAVLLHNIELADGGLWAREPTQFARIDQLLQKLHRDNKSSVDRLFSDEVVGRVALWGGNETGV
jgi:uncharacterized protein (TIGR04255 family)